MADVCKHCGVNRFVLPCPQPQTCGFIADALVEAEALYPLLDEEPDTEKKHA